MPRPNALSQAVPCSQADHAPSFPVGFNGPESPWKKICDELSDGTLASHFTEVTECKVLVQDALSADNSGGLVRILAKGHRDTDDHRVLLHILPGSSGYGVASASKRELEKQVSADRALIRGLKSETAVLKTQISWMETELESLKAGFDASKAQLASWTDAVPKADQGMKKRKMVSGLIFGEYHVNYISTNRRCLKWQAEMPCTEALFK